MMVTELYGSPGEFWAALQNLFSQGTGGAFLGYFLIITMMVAIGKFSGIKSAVIFAAVAIPILAGMGLLPAWIAVGEIMIVVVMAVIGSYNRMVSQ